MQAVKMVVTGPFGAGKTEFINTISEIEVVSTERSLTSGPKETRQGTTVAMDFGRITIDEALVLYLFGTPGQRRFDFMWEILSEGMLGFVVVVDSARPESFRDARAILDMFQSYSNASYVVAANKQDKADAWPPEDLRIALRVDRDVKVLPCVATERELVKSVLLELLSSVFENVEE